MSRPGSPSSGFTLLELLVVMVIIGLLAGFVGPRLFAQIGKSEIKAAHAQINGLQKALDQYRIDTGRYPSTEQGLAALNEKPADEPKWAGPYLSKAVPKDPWGRDYAYRSPGQHGEFDLSSRGPDRQPGGGGDSAEITSW
jgi:general secretion pathway protein G